ncbi:MAG: sigma-70 family RNA polymerase sigma factor [Polyangiales bacterium]
MRDEASVLAGAAGTGSSSVNRDSAEQLEAERLIEAAGRGDSAALIALYDRFAPTMLGLALRIVRSRSDAEDIVQDAFVRAWREAPSFDRARGSAATWLATLTRNRAIDLLRAKGRKLKHDAALSVEAERDGSSDESPEAHVSRGQRARAVREAIAGLSSDQRQALELAYFGGLSHSEIAEVLEQPLGTVKTRLLTAAKKLREALAAHGEPDARGR